MSQWTSRPSRMGVVQPRRQRGFDVVDVHGARHGRRRWVRAPRRAVWQRRAVFERAKPAGSLVVVPVEYLAGRGGGPRSAPPSRCGRRRIERSRLELLLQDPQAPDRAHRDECRRRAARTTPSHEPWSSVPRTDRVDVSRASSTAFLRPAARFKAWPVAGIARQGLRESA